MSYFKSGTVEVRGKRYDYTVTQLKSGEYKCVVQGCPGACMINSNFPAVGMIVFLLPEILLLFQIPYQPIEATAFQPGQFHSPFCCNYAILPLSIDLVPVFRCLQGRTPQVLAF